MVTGTGSYASERLANGTEGGTRRTRVKEGSAAMRLNSNWPEWVTFGAINLEDHGDGQVRSS